MAASPAPDDAHGHRARLRERLFSGERGALLDYEIVEYVLTLALRRGDTKAIAKRLMARFGTLPELFAASPEAIAQVPGMGEVTASAIKIVHVAAMRLLEVQTRERPVLSNWQALLDYLHADLSERINEQFRVIHLNTRNMVIGDDRMSEGSIDQTQVHVREVVRRAMELGSAAIILVHNHPSGSPQPSRADIVITRSIIDAARPLGIAVHDHLVIGRDGHVSLKAQGLI